MKSSQQTRFSGHAGLKQSLINIDAAPVFETVLFQ